MKKRILCGMVIAMTLVLSACKGELKSLNADNIKVNTIMIREDGIVQSAIVEEFDKPHYDKAELRSFIDEAVNEYNSTMDADSVVLDTFDIQGGSAKLVLTYNDLKDYAYFNEVEVMDMTVSEARLTNYIPDTLQNAEESATITKDEALADDTCRVLVISEGLDVIVNGKVKYYSNGVLLNNTTVQTDDKSIAVIIYKP